jgi:hypothetical protein
MLYCMAGVFFRLKLFASPRVRRICDASSVRIGVVFDILSIFPPAGRQRLSPSVATVKSTCDYLTSLFYNLFALISCKVATV